MKIAKLIFLHMTLVGTAIVTFMVASIIAGLIVIW